MAPSAPRNARQLAREHLTRQITDTARRHLAEVGPAALSLRAVARELGMVSSAVYRYFPSRDELLTALIVDAYDSLGEAVETAEAKIRRNDFAGRYRAAARAVRAWAVANPHEYALVYGTPIPGYAAPDATVGPATRVPLVLIGILVDACAVRTPATSPARLSANVRRELAALAAGLGAEVPEPVLAAGLRAMSLLLGTVSLQLFGHFHNVITDHDAWFDHVIGATVAELQLGP